MKARNYCRVFFICVLILSVLFGLCSCRLEESYKEFRFEQIYGKSVETYLADEELDFSRVGDVTIISAINTINYEECQIYLSAYSATGSEIVTIKRIHLTEGEDSSFTAEQNETVSFEKLEEQAEQIYRGQADGVIFQIEDFDISNGKVLNLDVDVEVVSEGECVQKTISYNIEIVGYLSFVTVT